MVSRRFRRARLYKTTLIPTFHDNEHAECTQGGTLQMCTPLLNMDDLSYLHTL